MKKALFRTLHGEICRIRILAQPKKAVSFLLIAAVLCCLYYFIGCPVYFVFGIPCPGCGMTRACFSVLSGQLAQAFQWNPLWPVLPPFLVLLAVKDGRIFRSKRINTSVYAVVFALTAGVYALRMILLFPHSAPMVYNGNSVINKIFDILGGVLT